MAFLRRKPKDSAPQGSFERLGTQSAKAGGGPAFNVLAAAFLGLSALMCLCYAAYFVPGLALPFAALPPTAVVLGPTPTPTWGLPPTWTPTVTGTPTETPPPPTITSTPPESTATRPIPTRLPTRTPTPTYGPSPTITPTRSKYPYTAEVTYQPSPINACGASYILGTITDLAGQPVTAGSMVIHVEGDGDIESAMHPGEQARGNRIDGPSPFTGMGFGPSAWNVVLNLSGTSAGTWRVWLVQSGQASDMIEIRLESSCVRSSAIVRFQQNH